MIERVLADFVVLVHFAFIVFVVLGGLLALRWRFAPWIHLPSVAYGVGIELTGAICPLTPLENRLRGAAGAGGYEGGFVEHYLLPVIYPTGLTPQVQIVLAVLLVAVNGVVYAWVFRRRSSG